MSGGRVYTVEFGATTLAVITAAQDLFELQPADDKPVAIIGWDLAQTTELGDGAEEILRLQIVRGHTTSGSVGGTNPTPRPVVPSDVAAGFVCEINNTTIASVGTPVVLWSGGWNVRVPGPYFLPEDCRIWCTQAQTTMVLRLTAAPADSISVTGTMFVLEIG